MEVCQKCHEEIKPEDKFIVGDPNKWSKIAGSSISNGYNGRNRYNSHPKAQNNKYHLECYKEAEKKDKIGAIWLVIGLLVVAGIICAIVIPLANSAAV